MDRMGEMSEWKLGEWEEWVVVFAGGKGNRKESGSCSGFWRQLSINGFSLDELLGGISECVVDAEKVERGICGQG